MERVGNCQANCAYNDLDALKKEITKIRSAHVFAGPWNLFEAESKFVLFNMQ